MRVKPKNDSYELPPTLFPAGSTFRNSFGGVHVVGEDGQFEVAEEKSAGLIGATESTVALEGNVAERAKKVKLEKVWIETSRGEYSDKMTVKWLKKLPGAAKGVVTTDGSDVSVDLRWIKAGQGPKVQVLIPPTAMPADHYRRMLEKAMEGPHAEEFTFVVIEPPGHGFSEQMDDVELSADFMIEQTSNAIKQVLKELEQARGGEFSSVTLSGESSGATIAAGAALDPSLQGMVDGVVLSNLYDNSDNAQNLRESAPFVDFGLVGFDLEAARNEAREFFGMEDWPRILPNLAEFSLSLSPLEFKERLLEAVLLGGIPEKRHEKHMGPEHTEADDGVVGSVISAGMAMIENFIGAEEEDEKDLPWVTRLSRDAAYTYSQEHSSHTLRSLMTQEESYIEQRERYHELKQLGVDVTVVYGRKDWSPEDVREENIVSMGLEEGEAIELKGRGHFQSFDDPKQLLDVFYHHHGFETQTKRFEKNLERSNETYFGG